MCHLILETILSECIGKQWLDHEVFLWCRYKIRMPWKLKCHFKYKQHRGFHKNVLAERDVLGV